MQPSGGMNINPTGSDPGDDDELPVGSPPRESLLDQRRPTASIPIDIADPNQRVTDDEDSDVDDDESDVADDDNDDDTAGDREGVFQME